MQNETLIVAPEDSYWVVRRESDQTVIGAFDTRAAAVKFATHKARREDVPVLVKEEASQLASSGVG